jgi:hypothetical protein
MSLITLGLSQINVGTASTSGTMPSSMSKIGKTYKDSCKLAQDKADVTQHFEEGKSAPEVTKKQKKIPVLTFSIMDADVDTLISYVGGTNIGTAGAKKWGFDGTETVDNKAIQVVTEQGLLIDIPNADIEATINAEFSAKGIFLVEFTVTPQAVTSGKSIHSYAASSGLVVAPTSLNFTAAADATGQTITATSTGNVSYASAPNDVEWLTVTRSGKVVTVKVTANTNSESRTANVTIVADGLTAIVPVTQAGA